MKIKNELLRSTIILQCFIFGLQIIAQRDDFNEIDFQKAEHIALNHLDETLLNLPHLAHKLTARLDTDVEKYRAIYYWVCHTIKGNESLVSRNTKKLYKYRNDPKALENWKLQFKKEVYLRLLKDKETLCTGYSLLVKTLSNLAGLECEIIQGYNTLNSKKISDPNAPNHSWNAVKIDGKWYLSDATWSSGYTDISTMKFIFDYDDTYFLMSPILFGEKAISRLIRPGN